VGTNAEAGPIVGCTLQQGTPELSDPSPSSRAGAVSFGRVTWPPLHQELRTQDLAEVLWPTRRRFDPSSSPSATGLGSLPSDSVDRPQNPQQTETLQLNDRTRLSKGRQFAVGEDIFLQSFELRSCHWFDSRRNIATIAGSGWRIGGRHEAPTGEQISQVTYRITNLADCKLGGAPHRSIPQSARR
jgi:hypothetical protein